MVVVVVVVVVAAVAHNMAQLDTHGGRDELDIDAFRTTSQVFSGAGDGMAMLVGQTQTPATQFEIMQARADAELNQSQEQQDLHDQDEQTENHVNMLLVAMVAIVLSWTIKPKLTKQEAAQLYFNITNLMYKIITQ